MNQTSKPIITHAELRQSSGQAEAAAKLAPYFGNNYNEAHEFVQFLALGPAADEPVPITPALMAALESYRAVRPKVFELLRLAREPLREVRSAIVKIREARGLLSELHQRRTDAQHKLASIDAFISDSLRIRHPSASQVEIDAYAKIPGAKLLRAAISDEQLPAIEAEIEQVQQRLRSSHEHLARLNAAAAGVPNDSQGSATVVAQLVNQADTLP